MFLGLDSEETKTTQRTSLFYHTLNKPQDTMLLKQFKRITKKMEVAKTERLVVPTLSDADKKSVYYMDDSRTNTALFTVGRGEIQETWIKMSGGKFATQDLIGSKIEISKEKLLAIDPDIILVGSQRQYASMQMLMSDRTLSNLKAVKNNQVYHIPQGIFPWCKTGPESSMQMVWTAKQLYPDLFADIDLTKMTKFFYLDFFDAAVSDENVAMILAGKLLPTGE